MRISESTQIKAPKEKIWNVLSSFDNVEKYLSIVTKSVVEGSGQGSKRTCDVSMGSQMFQIKETLEILDNSNHSLTISLNDGPIQMRGMKFVYDVKGDTENISDVTISTNVENPDAAAMAKNFFALIGQGLKKYHEL
jgi:carbon monoxide dehydrogenase subunit G